MMKRKILGVLMLSILTIGFVSNVNAGNALPESWCQQSPIFKVVSATEFKTLMAKKGIQLIDVRTPQEFGNGKIGNAKNIDFFGASFKTELSKLDKTKPVLIYCQSGNRSGQAVTMMKSMGFKEVYDLKGGWGAWPK
jgi:rhodanese-related sulfurtransferase